MVSVSGKIIGLTEKNISPKPGGKQFDPFTVFTYFIQDDRGGRPEEVRSTANSRKIGQKVDIEVYPRVWASGDRCGYNYQEIKPK